MINNIIFDWSGVISDNAKLTYRAAMTVLKTYGGKRLSFEEFKEKWQMPYMDFYKNYLPDLTKEQQDVVFKAVYPKLPKPKPYRGIREFIVKCKAKDLKIFVVTSEHKDYLFSEIKEFKLDGLLDDVACGAHDKLAGLNQIISSHQLKREETIFIGDTDYEIFVGQEAGVLTIGVVWGVHSESRLKKARPDYLAHNIKELKQAILMV
ncbi:MAG: HAD family hydrolase [Patescibacteria group bacterium]|nr:HAD family hydrolase [Patescibacteria group bacterium]